MPIRILRDVRPRHSSMKNMVIRMSRIYAVNSDVTDLGRVSTETFRHWQGWSDVDYLSILSLKSFRRAPKSVYLTVHFRSRITPFMIYMISITKSLKIQITIFMMQIGQSVILLDAHVVLAHVLMKKKQISLHRMDTYNVNVRQELNGMLWG